MAPTPCPIGRGPDNSRMTDKDVPAADRDEAHAIDEVIDRLAERFPTLERTHVEEIVTDEWHRLDEGRVRDFVPVLVEHEARERLRREAAPAPLDIEAEELRLVPTDEPQTWTPLRSSVVHARRSCSSAASTAERPRATSRETGRSPTANAP